MKKLVILTVLVGLLAAGCCTRMDASGNTTKSFANCISSAANQFCNPSATVKADAAVAATAVDGLLAILIAIPNPSSSIAATIEGLGGAKIIFSTVQSGGCVAFTALENALNALKAGQAAVPAPATLKAGPLVSRIPWEPTVLWNVVEQHKAGQ